MKKEKNPVILTEEDFGLLQRFTHHAPNEEMSLAYELARAIIVKDDALPPHTVRLNAEVTVMDQETKKLMQFFIVLPHHANIQQRKISILTPMGTALIGFRKGEEVEWKVPAGLRKFKILDVVNIAA